MDTRVAKLSADLILLSEETAKNFARTLTKNAVNPEVALGSGMVFVSLLIDLILGMVSFSLPPSKSEDLEREIKEELKNKESLIDLITKIRNIQN